MDKLDEIFEELLLRQSKKAKNDPLLKKCLARIKKVVYKTPVEELQSLIQGLKLGFDIARLINGHTITETIKNKMKDFKGGEA
tara:strand:- start:230 stop:478 length:249 start_codon:yes stop_codon:yes gene_type:complete